MTSRRANKTPTRPATVGETIKQNAPFRSIRHEATVAMLLTADAVRRPIQALLADHGGLTHQQYNVLRILRGAHPEGLPTLEIAERMIERTPGITRLIDRLEAKSLVGRERALPDRRQVLVRLTPAGERLLAELDAPVQELDEHLLEGLDDGGVRQLLNLLDLVRGHLPD